jgi:uncharacterized protein YfaP (DUF2135 family)
VLGTAPLLTPIALPLTLSEQLDAMLSGWLDRHDPDWERRENGAIAQAVITVATAAVSELHAFCARWQMTLRRSARGERWAVLVVEGPALPVQGLTEITGMYRR